MAEELSGVPNHDKLPKIHQGELVLSIVDTNLQLDIINLTRANNLTQPDLINRILFLGGLLSQLDRLPGMSIEKLDRYGNETKLSDLLQQKIQQLKKRTSLPSPTSPQLGASPVLSETFTSYFSKMARQQNTTVENIAIAVIHMGVELAREEQIGKSNIYLKGSNGGLTGFSLIDFDKTADFD